MRIDRDISKYIRHQHDWDGIIKGNKDEAGNSTEEDHLQKEMSTHGRAISTLLDDLEYGREDIKDYYSSKFKDQEYAPVLCMIYLNF